MGRQGETEHGPGVTLGEMGLDQFAPYLLSRALSRWADATRDTLRAHDLSVNQMRVLAALSVKADQSIQELSQFTSTEPSTMSRTLDSLERKDLVRREMQAGDGRLRVITCTQAGKDTFASLWPQMHSMYEQMMVGIDEDERHSFFRTLEKVAKNLEPTLPGGQDTE